MSQSQVQVKFVAKNAKYAVTDTPITVPSNIKRYGLSEIVNHLLGNNEKPVPFDFLIDGEFLRTSVEDYLEINQISKEILITVEYVESLLPPNLLSGYQHDDWVSCVRTSKGPIVTGSYDNNIRIWDKSKNCLMTIKAHEMPIKDVTWLNEKPLSNQVSTLEIVSSSDDKSVKIWNVNLQSKTFENTVEILGHESSVTSIDTNYGGSRIVTASWDSSVKIWNPNEEKEDDGEKEKEKDKSLKRKKRTAEKKIVETPLVVLSGHSECVSKVIWSKKDTKDMFTSSWDHTIKVWDATTAMNISNLTCDQSVLCLDYSEKTGLLISGHSDCTTRVWDPRVQEGIVVKTKLSSHTGWVGCVSWCPDSVYNFASGSHDKSMKIWDLRSKMPLHTVKQHQDKVLCVEWSEDMIATGSADGQLSLFTPPTLKSEKDE